MSRNDYDDMGQSFSRRGKGGDKKTYVISFMGVLIILIAIIVYIIFKPVDDGDGAIEEENTSAIELNIPDVEEISVERSDDTSSIADDVFFVKLGRTLLSHISRISSSLDEYPV